MTILRQSTARTVLVGPILDSTGAAKTDEVVGSIKVTKNGTVGAANGSTTLTHDHAGKYKLAMAAGDADTVGVLEISLNSGTNDMPVARFNVVEEAVFDALFAASATGYSTYAGGDTSGTTTLLSRILGTLDTGTHKPQSGDAYAYLGTNLGAAGAAATEAGGTGDQFTALGDTRLANLNATVGSRSSHSAADVVTALGTGSTLTSLASAVNLATVAGYLDTEIASILGYVDATAANQATIINHLAAIKGTGWIATDNLHEIAGDAETAAGAGLGTGARTVTPTVNDGTTPLEGARIRFTKGAESYVGTTNASGQVTSFNLDDGTWTVAISLSGYTFAGATLVVDDNETVTYSMTAVSITSSEPGKTTLYADVYQETGLLAVAGVSVYLEMVTPPSGTGYVFDASTRTATTNSSGRVEFTNCIQGAVYQMWASTNTARWPKQSVTIGVASTQAAGNLIGAY